MKLSTMDIARGNLLIDHPFFGAMAARLKPVPDPQVEGAATNGREIRYDPEWFEGLSPREQVGLLAHEILHVASLHHVRRGSRDPELWNVACDYAINQELTEEKISLPEGALLDSRWKGMGAEQIYSALSQEQKTGERSPKPQGWGGVEDARDESGQPIPSGEMDQAEAEAKVMIGQALQQAKGMGKLSASLDRLVTDLMAPRLDWRVVLAQFIQTSSNSVRHDWSRPNKRLIGHGFYLPRMKGESLEVMVAIDTSGSVDEEQLRQFLGEVEGILSACSSKVWIVYCDREINRIEEVTSEDLPLQVRPCGGGGTDFRPVFQFWNECEGTPSCLVYITDMMGSFPDTVPDFPVLWVKTEKDIPAPFGEEVLLN